MQKNKTLILYYRQKSTKKKKRPKYKTATLKFLNENIGEKLHGIGLRTDFLDVMWAGKVKQTSGTKLNWKAQSSKVNNQQRF